MDWLDEVREASKDAESPWPFILWAAIVTAGAIAGKNVYIQRGNVYRLYPNLFVLIVGPSGVRKSFPIDLSKRLTALVNTTRPISGRNSIQAIINTLHKSYTIDRAVPLTSAWALLISGEFSNLVISDLSALTILTEWYDTYFVEQWKNTLKHSNQEVLNDVCISLLGATNDEHFRDKILDKDVKGGFMARTLCVYERDIENPNALMDDDDAPGIDWEKLAERLMVISRMEGRMRFTQEAKDLFKPWYDEFIRQHHNWDRTGITRRIHDHTLKTAMILSMIRRDDLVIDKEEIQSAFNLCLPLMRNTELIVRGKGKSETGDLVDIFLDKLLDQPEYKISRSEFLRKYYADFGLKTLNEVAELAEQAGWITSALEEGDRFYYLRPEWIDMHKKLLKPD